MHTGNTMGILLRTSIFHSKLFFLKKKKIFFVLPFSFVMVAQLWGIDLTVAQFLPFSHELFTFSSGAQAAHGALPDFSSWWAQSYWSCRSKESHLFCFSKRSSQCQETEGPRDARGWYVGTLAFPQIQKKIIRPDKYLRYSHCYAVLFPSLWSVLFHRWSACWRISNQIPGISKFWADIWGIYDGHFRLPLLLMQR